MGTAILVLIGVLVGLAFLAAVIWLSFAWRRHSTSRRRSRLAPPSGDWDNALGQAGGADEYSGFDISHGGSDGGHH
jgi:hypothetical protein